MRLQSYYYNGNRQIINALRRLGYTGEIADGELVVFLVNDHGMPFAVAVIKTSGNCYISGGDYFKTILIYKLKETYSNLISKFI